MIYKNYIGKEQQSNFQLYFPSDFSYFCFFCLSQLFIKMSYLPFSQIRYSLCLLIEIKLINVRRKTWIQYSLQRNRRQRSLRYWHQARRIIQCSLRRICTITTTTRGRWSRTKTEFSLSWHQRHRVTPKTCQR